MCSGVRPTYSIWWRVLWRYGAPVRLPAGRLSVTDSQLHQPNPTPKAVCPESKATIQSVLAVLICGLTAAYYLKRHEQPAGVAGRAHWIRMAHARTSQDLSFQTVKDQHQVC